MQDSEIVAAIVAGESAGLASAYDRYAPALYGYCRSLLSEPADASDAVQDTFVIAAAKLGGLRDPDRLRPWLYAVARNECRRRQRTAARDVGLDEADDVKDEAAADVGKSAEQAELRTLVASAVNGLNPGDREVIFADLRHDLRGADLADALGVPLNQAHAVASRARGQFETSLGALLVARAGRGSCPELDGLLAGWDGELTALMRKRLNRHIERCDVCGDCKRRELQPAMLLGLLPVVVLPAGLRQQVLSLISDSSTFPVSYRARVLARSGKFRVSGFPAPIDPPTSPRRARRYSIATTSVAAVALIAVAAFLFGPWRANGVQAAASKHTPHTTLSLTGTGSPTPTPSGAGHSRHSHQAHPKVSTTPTPTPSATTPTPSHRPTPKPTPSPTTTPGTLTETPSAVTLTLGPAGVTGSFTLTAAGGPVDYSITVPATPNGTLLVSPASGTLAAGTSTTVTVTWSGSSALPTTDLTVTPGGLLVSVTYEPIT